MGCQHLVPHWVWALLVPLPNALGRNPEKLSDIRTLMITAIVFADSLAIIGIIVAIIAKFL